jgi:hypothetical protein
LYGNGLERLSQPLEQLDREDLPIAMRRAGQLAGRVVDDATGQPITDFRIRLVNPKLAPGEEAASGIEVSWVDDGRPFHNEAGRWGMPGEELTLGGIFAVEARAAGYAPAVELHVVAEAEPDPDAHVLRLRRGVQLRGQVVAAGTGVAISGARVLRVPASDEGEPMRFADSSPAFQTTTGADGWFALDNVPAGLISLQVEHPDWLDYEGERFDAPAGGTPAPFRIELEAGARIAGLLLSADGEPLAREQVELESVDSDPVVMHASLKLLSDEHGRFVFEHLAEGLYQLRHTRMDGDRTLVLLSLGVVVPQQSSGELQLRPRGTARIRGRVLGSADAPARVQISLSREVSGSDQESERLRTGSQRRALSLDGEFSFEGLEAGSYRLTAYEFDSLSSKNWSGTTRITIVDGETTGAELSLKAR